MDIAIRGRLNPRPLAVKACMASVFLIAFDARLTRQGLGLQIDRGKFRANAGNGAC